MALQNTVTHCRYTVHRVECRPGGGMEGGMEVLGEDGLTLNRKGMFAFNSRTMSFRSKIWFL